MDVTAPARGPLRLLVVLTPLGAVAQGGAPPSTPDPAGAR